MVGQCRRWDRWCSGPRDVVQQVGASRVPRHWPDEFEACVCVCGGSHSLKRSALGFNRSHWHRFLRGSASPELGLPHKHRRRLQSGARISEQDACRPAQDSRRFEGPAIDLGCRSSIPLMFVVLHVAGVDATVPVIFWSMLAPLPKCRKPCHIRDQGRTTCAPRRCSIYRRRSCPSIMGEFTPEPRTFPPGIPRCRPVAGRTVREAFVALCASHPATPLDVTLGNSFHRASDPRRPT